ncbi:MAG: heavy metal translocating P-type ATPase [Microbacteriaceae bacterium]
MGARGGLVLRYPFITAIGVVAAIAGVLEYFGSALVPWLVSGFALLVAARSAWHMLRDLVAGHAGIDILAVLAITAAVTVGEYWAALVVSLMLTGGEALEDFAAQRARRELSALLERAPRIAHRIDPHGELVDIQITEVAIGDRLVVKPSEVLPVDGVLLSDQGTFDESSLTGESLPVERQAGESLLSGALNSDDAIEMRASATAENSQYQGIVRLVEQAAASRSRVVRLADRYAVPFTVAALVIAALAWWASGDPVRIAEVLVVATPCPLLIAAPVAYMAGMSRLAKAGVIVKGASTLEVLARARSVAMDKTGTLTGGAPTLAEVRPAPGYTADEVLQYAASAEAFSSHVLAQSVITSANGAGLPLLLGNGARELAANGVSALIHERAVSVGKSVYIADIVGHPVDTPIGAGELAIHVAFGHEYAGAIVLRDAPRENARETVEALRTLGLSSIVMLTGDARDTAMHVAGEVGIQEVYADCLPADKVRLVAALPARPVIMVGDGVNDAPVLAVADVGIAMGARGATAASQSAAAVILVDDISRVATAVQIGRDTVRVALQSIWLGIALSLILMVVAALGYLPAIVGAWLQEVVDLVTILGALRALGGRDRDQ